MQHEWNPADGEKQINKHQQIFHAACVFSHQPRWNDMKLPPKVHFWQREKLKVSFELN